MAIPISQAVNKEQLATNVFGMFQRLNDQSGKCVQLKNNNDFQNLYFLCVDVATQFQNMANAGYTADIIGPILGAKFDLDWADYEQDFLALKTTHIPGYLSVFTVHQEHVVARQLGASGSEPKPMPTDTVNALVAAAQAIFDTFG